MQSAFLNVKVSLADLFQATHFLFYLITCFIGRVSVAAKNSMTKVNLRRKRQVLADGSRGRSQNASWWGRAGMAAGVGNR